MPFVSLVFTVCVIAMFVSFIAVLGGVNLWMTLLDRRDAARAPTAASAEAPEMRRAA